MDENAEITVDTVADGVEANPDEDEMYSRGFTMSKPILEQRETSVPVDSAEWRLEVERVTPLLKVKLANDNKDWRIHVQQMQHHNRKIDVNMGTTNDYLSKLQIEVEQAMEKINSREKYVNSQFSSEVSMMLMFSQIGVIKNLQISSHESKQKFSAASSSVAELSNELQRVSEALHMVKSKMDDLGSGMTDAKPLIAIKFGAAKIKVK